MDLVKKIFQNYSTVKKISRNHYALVEQSVPVDNLPNPLKVMVPKSNSMIGIIDTGIESSSNIFTNLIVAKYPQLPPNSVSSPNDHGTFVASRCLFGDKIDNCITTHKLEPYCRVIDIPVFGKDFRGNEVALSELQLMKAIQNIVPRISNKVKVFNLLLGFNNSIRDFSYSNLAKLIDYISKVYNVIFVISAGNINQLLGDFPVGHFNNLNSRINSPAESLLSITVGSIAKYDNSSSLSKCNQPSPFTRIGPGADKGIKPELVPHGGNLAVTYNPLPRIAAYGIDKDGKKLSVDNGTSFS